MTKEENMHHTTPYDPSFPPCERTDARLTIWSSSVSPAQFTDILAIEPDEAHYRGERIENRRTGRVRISRNNFWTLTSEGKISSKDLRDHLDWLLGLLERSREGLLHLQALDVRMSVMCVWWASEGGGGPVLWPDQTRKLASLNLECAFDFQDYGDEGTANPNPAKNA